MESIITPRTLKGFRDALPADEIARSELIERITRVFRLYGFVPIDTPALEYSEILLRKSEGETEKQVFRFKDQGGRDVALRFDLTVPLARFCAEHRASLYFPFKRYHIAKVWRGEKPQAGRYREFMQCDVDTIGSDSALSDFEILCVMRDSLSAAGAGNTTVHLNHRGMFNRFLSALDIREKSEDILRAVDKLAKTGEDAVLNDLMEITQSADKSQKILEYISFKGSFSDVLREAERLSGGESEESARMKALYEMITECGYESSFVFDTSITRGLDYYTGVVYETFLNALPSIGSVCSGGRYDNLCALYSKERMPGVGASIGLDRLITALSSAGAKGNARKSYLDAVIFNDGGADDVALTVLAKRLRDARVACEVFPDKQKMARQYAVCEEKGVAWGVFARGSSVSLRNLAARETQDGLTAEAAAEKILASREKADCGSSPQ